MAWMEMECNLKKISQLSKFIALRLEKLAKTMNSFYMHFVYDKGTKFSNWASFNLKR